MIIYKKNKLSLKKVKKPLIVALGDLRDAAGNVADHPQRGLDGEVRRAELRVALRVHL